jgi:hypothetical protein
MRLIGNKQCTIDYLIFLDEDNILDSDINIWDKQHIDALKLITSDYLIDGIYHDIKR